MHLRFDHGTIVLSDPPRGIDLTDLPGVMWDPRIGVLGRLCARGVSHGTRAVRPRGFPAEPRDPRVPLRQAGGGAALLARHVDSRVLVFTPDNATAYAVAREHLLMPIICDISRPERASALERFRRGELRALVSARVLNEGIDVPEAEVAIVVGGTQGENDE